ncbi:hypothetical protein PINS_up009269 [Pythium insidiosum]|nr:hypothetical protein PINS_up009269 [Pythium insidiosum]
MEPSVRGALRSETKATALALRGETATATQAQDAVDSAEDEEGGEHTPPPSPSSAAALAASFGADDDYVDEDDGDSSVSDDDEEYSEKAASRKRRAKSSSNGRKRLRRGDQALEVESEATSGREDVKFHSDRRGGRSQQNWVDDGCAATFEARLAAFRRNVERSVAEGTESFYHKPRKTPVDDSVDDGGFDDEIVEDEAEEEGAVTDYTPQDVLVTDSGLSVPTYIHAHLYPHQKECLEWLHHLHERNTGGILGDDMGLGKTVQIAAFLGAMHHARRLRTVLLLCPASVLLQWVREFHTWYPPLRVVLLHASGTGVSRANRTYAELIDEVTRSSSDDHEGGGVLVTTYENVRQYQELFVDVEWDYVVLDEGHRIRNPDAEITLVCKQLKTVHRVLLTGTPIQNRLRELWSLFDFVYPGKLGTLPTFEDEFVLPIRTGGYANASKMQVVMAYKCALALRDVIAPFLLRRTKKEIQHVTKMPEKMEQILFCTLTRRQYETYEAFLASAEVAAVLRQDVRPFRAISILRHICNHPDLLSTMEDAPSSQRSGGRDHRFAPPARDADEPYGAEHASGKMLVLQKILRLWKQQGHRVLLFTQTRKMLDILESFMAREGHLYCRLDGTTSVRERQSLLDAFNREHSEIFVFLLTTRAGGIGVNLTGADRVVIFDPDWNPSTDLQARERSWRLGQTRAVTIYRLITSGTIEEKIYHRQIFKQYLTSKVLHDAKRKRCFNKHTLRDLFVLTDQRTDSSVETTEILVEGNVARPSPSRSEPGNDQDAAIDGQGNGDDEEEEDKDKDASTASASVDDAEEEGDRSPDTEAAPGAGAGAGAGDNDAILQHLFDGEQIKGVFNHDVVEADGVQNQEADLIEMESTKIAESALSALRASCALIRQQRETEYTPTWTGRSGTAGDPSQRNSRFGGRVARGRAGTSVVVNVGRSEPPRDPFAQRAVSSREMLARIKGRRNGVQAAANRTSPAPHIQSNGFMSVDQMTKQLHAFLLTRCGTNASAGGSSRAAQGVTTEELLDVFASVVAPKDKLVFRNLLRDMAVCRGRRWVLKPEYMTGGS